MSADGFTIDGLAQALNMSRERIETAVSDLVRTGMIELVSEGRWRPTEAGRAIFEDQRRKEPKP
jgi:predicted transcriptional regulator